jgi:hypothetical protein
MNVYWKIWSREFLLTTLLHDVTFQCIIQSPLCRSIISSWTTTRISYRSNIWLCNNRNVTRPFHSMIYGIIMTDDCVCFPITFAKLTHSMPLSPPHLLTFFISQVTPCNRVLSISWWYTQLVKKFPAIFWLPKGSLSFSQQPASNPYPEPGESNPHPPIDFPKIHFNIILLYIPGVPSDLFPSVLPTNILCFSYPPCMLYAPPISSPLIRSSW